MTKTNWRTTKDKVTGNTIIEVCNSDGAKLNAVIPAYRVRQMTTQEFQRLIKQLAEAMTLYESKS